MDTTESDVTVTNLLNIINGQPTKQEVDEDAEDDTTNRITEPRQKPIPKFKPEDLYYDMSGEKFLIIFNHKDYLNTKYYRKAEKCRVVNDTVANSTTISIYKVVSEILRYLSGKRYSKPKSRIGTEQDVRALKYAFGKLGFKVLTYTDFEHEQIMNTVQKISFQDHTRTSCLAVAILTHGEKGGGLYAADRPYLLRDITTLLEHGHSSLVTKPKLFFIQACRGDLSDSGRTVEYDAVEDNTLIVPTHSDFFFMFSSVEDHLSWRDSRGSWLIQELCNVIQTYHEEFDLLHLATIAMRNVAYTRSSYNPMNKSMHNKKQTPEIRYTLTKLLKFQSF